MFSNYQVINKTTDRFNGQLISIKNNKLRRQTKFQLEIIYSNTQYNDCKRVKVI
jgi:hypothetical protein